MTTLPPSPNVSSSLKNSKPRAGRGLAEEAGAGNEARTRDLNLGKVALYQLSYSRPKQTRNCRAAPPGVKKKTAQNALKALNCTTFPRYRLELSRNSGHANRRYRTIDHSVRTAATALKISPNL